MKLLAWICILLFPEMILGQGSVYLGLQATPLSIGTFDVHAENRLTNTMSLYLGTGFRTQQIDRREPRVRLLNDFSNLGNTATFLTLGIRLFNPETGIDYPYVQFGLTGLWYRDRFLNDAGEQEISSDITWGPSATIGYVLNVNLRWTIDLGLQMGYSAPRTDLLAYYYPGLGFSTFGLGRYGVVGGHVQPVVALKYKIRLSDREKLRLAE
ncbi:MAG: hypothetical protein NWR72_08525 [Bacteroidia bacterium]|nr:hypothetical protein [Bacteroidia bacterium]